MKQVEERSGVYIITATASLRGATRRVLPDAVPPVTPLPQSAVAPSYGWVSGACPAPFKGDRYLVEFVGGREFCILAYLDRFGRVFATDRPLASPPARKPDLNFARYAEPDASGEEQGCVEVRTEDDPEGREVARYTFRNGRYTLWDTWYDFGPYGSGLSYDDALARAYLAFVHRPSLGGVEVPARGTACVHEQLRGVQLIAGLRAVVDVVRRAQADPVLRPPALVASLVRWLEDAGASQIMGSDVPDDALRLVRTVRYADIYYVAVEDEAAVKRRLVWALESALNRFALVEEAFEERAPLATEADCARWDAYLIETAAARPLSDGRIPGAPQGIPGGEWETRCRVGAVLERLKLPVRIEARLQANVEEGAAAFELTVPDGALMPRLRWVDAPGGGNWAVADDDERSAQARRYAMRFGLVLAASAFEASPALQRVDVAARPLGDGSTAAAAARAEAADDAVAPGQARGGEFPVEHPEAALYLATFTRQLYEESGRFRSALEGDPESLFAQCGALFDLPGADPFALVEALPFTRLRRELPEMEDAALPEAAQAALGAGDAEGLRIVADARRRRIAENLADRIACASSATQAIHAVRSEQDAAEERGDDRVVSACTRLMAALAEGTLDTEDQNAVVGCFLGEDRCLAALGRARAIAPRDPAEAAAVLMDAVAEAAALDGYVDGAVTAYRAFDSYASRVLYARALRAAQQEHAAAPAPDAPAPAIPSLAQRAAADANKRILLAPDSLYLCHLEIVTLLERSFDRTDDALRYGQRALELAPTAAAGYRQLGRAYMLVGDMDNAVAVLEACLRVAVQPSDVAIAYYQLAYALWKAGRPRAGAACYLKSVMCAPVVALQAMAELKELVAEHGIDPVERDEVDGALRDAGVTVAPAPEVYEAINEGAAAAVDAGLFSVARSLLSLRLHYRPDDALVNVVKSLEG